MENSFFFSVGGWWRRINTNKMNNSSRTFETGTSHKMVECQVYLSSLSFAQKRKADYTLLNLFHHLNELSSILARLMYRWTALCVRNFSHKLLFIRLHSYFFFFCTAFIRCFIFVRERKSLFIRKLNPRKNMFLFSRKLLFRSFYFLLHLKLVCWHLSLNALDFHISPHCFIAFVYRRRCISVPHTGILKEWAKSVLNVSTPERYCR